MIHILLFTCLLNINFSYGMERHNRLESLVINLSNHNNLEHFNNRQINSFFEKNYDPLAISHIELPDSMVIMHPYDHQQNLATPAPLTHNIPATGLQLPVTFFDHTLDKGLLNILPEYNSQNYKQPNVSFDTQATLKSGNVVTRTPGFSFQHSTASYGNIYARISKSRPEPHVSISEMQKRLSKPDGYEFFSQKRTDTDRLIKNTEHYLNKTREPLTLQRIKEYELSITNKPLEQLQQDTTTKRKLLNESQDLRKQLKDQLNQRNNDLNKIIKKEMPDYPHIKGHPEDREIWETMLRVDAFREAVAQAELALAQADDNIKVLKHAITVNEEYIKTVGVIQEENQLASQSLIECKESLKSLEEQKKSLHREKVKYALESHHHKTIAENIKGTLNRAWLPKVLRKWRGYEKVEAHYKEHAQAELAAKIAHREKDIQHEVTCRAIDECKNLIIQRELTDFRDIAQHMYSGKVVNIPDTARDSQLIKAVDRSIREKGAIHEKTYFLTTATRDALEKLGVNLKNKMAITYEGNHAQLYVYSQLIDSINRIGSIPQSNPQVQHLLKDALVLNTAGRELNKQHQLSHAISAKLACDAVINYAKSVGDLVLAAGEGPVEGVRSTIEMGRTVVNAVLYPEEAFVHVKNTFNNAVLAISDFIAESRKNYEILVSGNEQAFKQLEAKWAEDSKKAMEDYFKDRPPLRDQVKAVTKLFTECAMLSPLGEALGASLGIKESIAVASSAIENIIANPKQALAREVMDMTMQTIEQEPTLVSTAIKAVQQDAQFLKTVQETGTSISKEINSIIHKEVGWGHWIDLNKIEIYGKEYAKINNRLYTRHAIERMTPKGYGASFMMGVEGRGVPINVVEDVIANGIISETRVVNGVERISKTVDHVSVVLENDIVITILIKK